MNVPLWVAELADRYWSAVGEHEPFPRSFNALSRALPLSVIGIEQLTTDSMRTWLKRNFIPCELAVPNRPLRACLVAYRGQGFAFLDKLDSEEERRFSLAHELAHFLRDYLNPRETAVRKLGPAVCEVLDGDRLATPAERIHALLRYARIGVHVHLMDRREFLSEIQNAEDSADRLAFELLAPATDIFTSAKDRSAAIDTLRIRFGLPQVQAEAYAELLFPAPRMDPLLARLRLASSGAGA